MPYSMVVSTGYITNLGLAESILAGKLLVAIAQKPEIPPPLYQNIRLNLALSK